MTNDQARRNDEVRMTKRPVAISVLLSGFDILASFVIRHSCFVIFSSCEPPVCCRPDRGTAPSSKPAFRISRDQRSRRALLVSRWPRRCLQPQRRRSFRRGTVSKPDGNQLRSSPVPRHTRPNHLPLLWSSASARVFPDKIFGRVPYLKRRWL